MKDKRQAHSKKEIVFSLLGVVLLVVLVISVSYAAFVYTKAGVKENTITTGTVSFAYNETSNGITISNAVPISDATGKTIAATDTASGITQGYFDFTVTAAISSPTTTVSYEVYATLDNTTTMDTNYVKVYLTDAGNPEKAFTGYTASTVPVYAKLATATSDATGKRLYSGTMKSTSQAQKFRLRIWVADTYTTADVSKTFAMRVNVKAVI